MQEERCVGTILNEIIENCVDLTKVQQTKVLLYVLKIRFPENWTNNSQLCKEDHEVVTEFWRRYDFLTNQGVKLNHAKATGLIAINFQQFNAESKKHGLRELPRRSWTILFSGSKRYQFIANKVVRSSLAKKSVRCCVFEDTEYFADFSNNSQGDDK